MTAAFGQHSYDTSLKVSYKLPTKMLTDVARLTRSADVDIQFGTFHHAPRVGDVQPISPIVTLKLASNEDEIFITGLTDPIEITIPLVNQAVCGNDLSKETEVECRYWSDGSYKSDGCQTERLDETYVKCKCTHLTSFVVTPVLAPCAVGFTGKSGECRPCEPGSYKSAVGSADCLVCPIYSYSPAQSSSCSCNAGYTGPDGGECRVCQAGTFKAQPGAAKCTLCQQGKYSISSGAVVSGTCKNCAAGTFSSAKGADSKTACFLCEAGKYSSLTAASSNATCQNCLAGKFSTVSGATSATSCMACMKGKYSRVDGAESPNTCTDCTAGKYSTVSGSHSYEDCIDCDAGKLSAAGSDSSNDCKDESGPCTKGFTGTPGKCVKCEPGSFKSTDGSAQCGICPPNSNSVEGSRIW